MLQVDPVVIAPLEKNLFIERTLALVREEIPLLKTYPPDVYRVMRCLRDNLFDELFDVNAIIDSCGVRKASIYGRFKMYVGMSIRDYREERRIEAAKELLGYRELEIYLIAYQIGYGSHGSFARAFRRHVGCGPLAYREKMVIENVE